MNVHADGIAGSRHCPIVEADKFDLSSQEMEIDLGSDLTKKEGTGAEFYFRAAERTYAAVRIADVMFTGISKLYKRYLRAFLFNMQLARGLGKAKFLKVI